MAGTYGEVLPDGILSVLRGAGAKPGMRFYDLGSGTGKFVAIATQLLGLRATGIEISLDRHTVGCAAMGRLGRPGSSGPGGSARLVHGSFFDYDFSDADIVFVDNVEYTAEMNAHLAKLARSMKKGSVVVLDHVWDTPDFSVTKPLSARTTWNRNGKVSTWNMMRKVTESGPPTGLPGASAAGEQCKL